MDLIFVFVFREFLFVLKRFGMKDSVDKHPRPFCTSWIFIFEHEIKFNLRSKSGNCEKNVHDDLSMFYNVEADVVWKLSACSNA